MVARGFFAALIAAAALAAGAVAAMRFQDAAPADAVALLASGNGSLLCRIAAWGAAIAAALSVLTAFIAFAFDDDDEDVAGRRRGFPKAIPALFGLVSLALFWAMFDCAAAPPPERVVSAPVVEPATEEIVAPVVAPPIETPPPSPQVYGGWGYEWPYMIPLMKENGDWFRGEALADARAALTPASGDDGLRATLCGAQWVAIAGATSEEGPESRNLARSRARAAIAAETISRWLAAQAGACTTPRIFGVDLGQHVETGVVGDGSDTGWQRRSIIIVRQAAPGETALDAAAARAEIAAFLADDDAMAGVLGRRRYGRSPLIIEP